MARFAEEVPVGACVDVMVIVDGEVDPSLADTVTRDVILSTDEVGVDVLVVKTTGVDEDAIAELVTIEEVVEDVVNAEEVCGMEDVDVAGLLVASEEVVNWDVVETIEVLAMRKADV